jgi:hypothetical protein
MLRVIDLARYGIICAIFAAAGAGIIRALRAPIAPGIAALIGPALTQALLACVWGLAVVAGVPIKYVVMPAAVVLIGLAAYGFRSWIVALRSPPGRAWDTIAWRPIALLAVSLLIPPLVMLPFFVHGLADYFGSGWLDGWAYAALGQYLWNLPRGTEGGLTPIYQFASHTGGRRYGATSGLGLFSLVFAPGDLQAANGLLRAIAIFAFTSACAAVADVRARRPAALAWLTYPYVAMCGLSGWMLDVVWANNYDNTLALSCYPALIALVTLPAVLTTLGGATVLGVMVAGAVHTYPELAPVMLGATVLVGAETIWRRARRRGAGDDVPGGDVRLSRPRVPGEGEWRAPLRTAGAALVIAALLLVPSWRDLSMFFAIQVHNGLALTATANAAPPPGSGMFPGLLDAHTRLAALLAMGGERAPFAASWRLDIAAIWLLVLIVLGLWRLVRQGEIALPVVLVAHAVGAAWLLGHAHYDYGAYKMLLLGWWVAAFAVLTACGWLIDILRTDGVDRTHAWRQPLRAVMGMVAAMSLLIVPIVTEARAVSAAREVQTRSLRGYHAIDRLPSLIGQAPIALLSFDELATHWAAYYLRDANLLLAVRNGYVAMPQMQIPMARAHPISAADVHLIVTDADPSLRAIDTSGWRLAWSAGAFALWDTADQGWGAVTSIRDPAIFRASPRPRFYIQRGATLDVLASAPGTLTITGRVAGAPPASDPPCWRLAMRSTSGQTWDLRVRPGPVTFTVAVPAGASEIAMQGSAAVSASGPAAPAGAAVADVVFDDLFTQFHRADSKAAAAVAPPHFEPCDVRPGTPR